MTHWKTLTDARYVSASDVDQDTVVKIATATGGQGEGADGRKFKKPRLTFTGRGGVVMFPNSDGKPRPFFPSNTDCNTLTRLAGSPHVERWAGLVVTLYQTETKLKGQMVPCIRIRPKLVQDDRAKSGTNGSERQATPAPTAAAASTQHTTDAPAREPGSDDE